MPLFLTVRMLAYCKISPHQSVRDNAVAAAAAAKSVDGNLCSKQPKRWISTPCNLGGGDYNIYITNYDTNNEKPGT